MKVKQNLKLKGGNNMFAVFTVLFFIIASFSLGLLENLLAN